MQEQGPKSGEETSGIFNWFLAKRTSKIERDEGLRDDELVELESISDKDPKNLSKRRAVAEKHKRLFAAKAENFYKEGQKMPAYFLKHYLGGTGDTLVLSPEQMLRFPQAAEAVPKNLERFRQTINLPYDEKKLKSPNEISGIRDKILNLADGDTLTERKIFTVAHESKDVVKDNMTGTVEQKNFSNSLGSSLWR